MTKKHDNLGLKIAAVVYGIIAGIVGAFIIGYPIFVMLGEIR